MAQTTQILSVPINQESLDRIANCERYIPYEERKYSCTETAAAFLGHVTEDTFQRCAQQQRANPTPAQRETIEASLSRATNNTPVSLVPVNHIDNVFSQLTPGRGAMMCSSRPDGMGHTVVAALDDRGERVLIDPSIGKQYVGNDIQNYLQSQNLTQHSVPMVAPGPITFTPFGGGKCIMVNIPKVKDMYAMLGMVADKTFSRLVNKSSVPLFLFSVDLENTLHNMSSNKATLIYGDGHTMILLKKSRIELIDPVANKKLVGYSEIMKYLSTFTRIMTLYNTGSKSKSRTFKSKSRKSKSRTFKSNF